MSTPTPTPESTPPPDETGAEYQLPFPPGFTERGACPFDPPAMLKEYREQAEVQRIDLTDGGIGWLVTGYDERRKLLSDPRLSADRMRNPLVAKLPLELREQLMNEKADAGNFIAMDPPAHTRYRKPLTRHFTLPRMRRLELRIRGIVTSRLDEMLAGGTTADLVRDFAVPVASLAICELLGVAHDDREEFHVRADQLVNLEVSVEDRPAALDELRRFPHGQVRQKRGTPTDDLLSKLIHPDTEPPLTDDELVGMANLLLVGAHDREHAGAGHVRPPGTPRSARGAARAPRAARRGDRGTAALPVHRASRPDAHHDRGRRDRGAGHPGGVAGHHLGV
ncbi:hypothetical protein [Streptomyces asiaticus]